MYNQQLFKSVKHTLFKIYLKKEKKKKKYLNIVKGHAKMKFIKKIMNIILTFLILYLLI